MAAVTLAPFDFSDAASARTGVLLQFGRYRGGDFRRNLVLFIPFGVLVHHEGRRRSWKLLPLTVVVATGAFLLSAAIECAQAFLPSRFPSVTDVFANTVGALIGTAADRACGQPAVSLASSLRMT